MFSPLKASFKNPSIGFKTCTDPPISDRLAVSGGAGVEVGDASGGLDVHMDVVKRIKTMIRVSLMRVKIFMIKSFHD
jgi:hypothetical protein